MQIFAGRRHIGIDITFKEVIAVPIGGKQDVIAFPLIIVHALTEDRRLQRFVFERYIQDVILILNLIFLGFRPGILLTGLRIIGRMLDLPCFSSGTDLHFLLQRQLILPFKQ